MSLSKEEVLTIIRRIAALGDNPALGGGGMSARKICKLIEAFADLIDGEGDTEEELAEFAEEVRLLFENHGAERRGQWKRILDRMEKVREKIKELGERLRELRQHSPKEADSSAT